MTGKCQQIWRTLKYSCAQFFGLLLGVLTDKNAYVFDEMDMHKWGLYSAHTVI